MKKVLFVCLVFAAGFLFSGKAGAQTKIGYFSEEAILGAMPGFSKLDTLLYNFQQDSLQVEYDYTLKTLQHSDSLFKKDSATMPAKAREMSVSDMNKLKYKLINWNQYSEQMMAGKRDQLLDPFRRKILDAFTEVITEQKYTLVIKAEALSEYMVNPPLLDNITLRVAMKLKLPLPKETEDAWKAAVGGGAAKPAATPAKKP